MSAPVRRVLYIVDHLGLGGAQSSLVDTLPRLREHGYEPVVLALHKLGDAADSLRDAGVPVQSLGTSAVTLPFSLGRAVGQARALKASLVDAHLCVSSALGAHVARRLGLPLVVHVHNQVSSEDVLRRWFLRQGFRAASAAVCVSRAVADSVRMFMPGASMRVVTIYNPFDWSALDRPGGVDARVEWGIGADEGVVVFAGRLAYQKGLDVLLSAWANLLRNRRARLLILGDGPLRARLEARARSLGLAASVIFAGYRTNVPAIVRTCDVFVLSSRFEGLPVAVAEAMAVGVPVVASAVGGVPEIVTPEVTGLLVPPEDPHALSAALSRILDDEDLRRRLSEAARARVQQLFSRDGSVRDLADLYSHILSGASGPVDAFGD